MRRILPPMLLALFIALPTVAEDAYPVRFGILGVRDGLVRVVEETRRIPLRIGDPAFAFGYELHCRPGEEIDWATIATLPARPAEYSGDHYTLSDDLKTVIFDPPLILCKENDILLFQSRFDQGDPVGNWRLEIMVNGKSVKKLIFEVYEE